MFERGSDLALFGSISIGVYRLLLYLFQDTASRLLIATLLSFLEVVVVLLIARPTFTFLLRAEFAHDQSLLSGFLIFGAPPHNWSC